MPIPHGEFSRATSQDYRTHLNAFRDRVEATAKEAMEAGRPTFAVSVPDNVNSFMEDDVIREWEQQSWTVTRSNARNERMLNFE